MSGDPIGTVPPATGGLFKNVLVNPPEDGTFAEEPVNTELLAEEPVVDELTVEPNTTERTWEAFDARWETLKTESESHKDDIMNHMLNISKEFGLQQLDNAANLFGMAFAEIEKCTFYEQSALLAEIGPRAVVEEVPPPPPEPVIP